jgi:hypothetical protein
LIYGENLKNTLGKDRESEKNTEVRYVPQKLASPQGIIIYHDKILTIVWGEEPVVFLVKNREYANSMKMFFDLLWNEETRTYKGIKGLEIAYQVILDSLQPGEEYYIINTSARCPSAFRNFLKDFHRKRQEKNIRLKILHGENLRSTLGKDRESERNTEVKYISSGVVSPQGIIICKDKVMAIIWEREPIALLMESREYAKTMKGFFDMLWGEETRTYRGLDQIVELIFDTLNYKEVMFIGGGGYFYDTAPRKRVEEYCKKAIERGLIWKNLGVPKARGHEMAKLPFVRTRYLGESLQSPSVVWIWGDKVANMVWSEKPVAFVFENKETAQNYRKYFELLWKNAER